MAYQNPDLFKLIIDKLVHSSIQYLVKQLQSGADVVQIFESFGGALTPALFKKWSVEPILRIIQGVRLQIPDAPIIVFAKGVGAYTASFENEANVIGIDWQTEPKDVNGYLSATTPVQGNLDPLCLVCGGAQLDVAVDHILNGFSNRPHIFNLGHGIVPQTPIAHVEQLIERVREFKG